MTLRSPFALAFTTILFSGIAMAGDFKWSGTYRAEGVAVFNSEARAQDTTNKTYMLHHFILRPEIVAFDGFTIRGRFDILNNSDFPNSQLGAAFGTPELLGTTETSSKNPSGFTDEASSSALLQNQPLGGIGVNEIYATWNHEFGALTVGRAPIHFGMGMTFNSGNGAFDHWFDNRDLIAYKLVTGNLFVMPVIAKIHEGDIGGSDDIDDFIVQAQYENPETELVVGGIYQQRISQNGMLGNDLTTTTLANGGSVNGNYEVSTYNFYASQWINSFKVGFELGFMDGKTGLQNANGDGITQEAMGIAVKAQYLPEASNWEGVLDLGYASGDDPSTSEYEGYIFDRNYDVAFLMFNHHIGQADILQTSPLNGAIAKGSASKTFDTEAISNTLYASVGATYKWSQGKYAVGSKFTYGHMNQDPFDTDVDSGLGFELDLSMKYTPFEGFQWITRMGGLFPGEAFRGGSANGFDTETVFGIETKAAISF